MDMSEEIARAAYQLWESSGRIEGRDLENWVEAERIIATRQIELAKTAQKARGREAGTERTKVIALEKDAQSQKVVRGTVAKRR